MACFSYNNRRMCILLIRHLRKVSYGQQRKREYNFITKQNQTDTFHKQKKYLLDNVLDANDQPNCDRGKKLRS